MAVTNLQKFAEKEVDLKDTNDFAAVPGLSIWRFDADPVNTIPFHIRTGENSCGNPLERKQFKYIEFHGQGSGTARVRVYIDRRYICDGKVSFTEAPSAQRRLNLPLTRSVGYAIDIEFSSNSKPRAMEIVFEPMGES